MITWLFNQVTTASFRSSSFAKHLPARCSFIFGNRKRSDSVKWVPRMLMDDHKARRMDAALAFLERYEGDGNTFIDQIVIEDETWVSHNTPTRKRQFMEWRHTLSPQKPCKFKQTASSQTLMSSVFWDSKVVLLVDSSQLLNFCHGCLFSMGLSFCCCK